MLSDATRLAYGVAAASVAGGAAGATSRHAAKQDGVAAPCVVWLCGGSLCPPKPTPEEAEMRLFKRKPEIDDAVRCPSCRERVPEGAAECAMCGRDLTRRGDARERDSERVGARP